MNRNTIRSTIAQVRLNTQELSAFKAAAAAAGVPMAAWMRQTCREGAKKQLRSPKLFIEAPRIATTNPHADHIDQIIYKRDDKGIEGIWCAKCARFLYDENVIDAWHEWIGQGGIPKEVS